MVEVFDKLFISDLRHGGVWYSVVLCCEVMRGMVMFCMVRSLFFRFKAWYGRVWCGEVMSGRVG